MKQKAWIRPVWQGERTHAGFALCTTNGTLLTDSQIVEHFDRQTTGKEIKELFGDRFDIQWGEIIHNEGPDRPFKPTSITPRSPHRFT